MPDPGWPNYRSILGLAQGVPVGYAMTVDNGYLPDPYALEALITPECPASVVRTHPHAQVFLETSSAALLSASKASMSDAR